MKRYTKAQLAFVWFCLIGGKVINGAIKGWTPIRAELLFEVFWTCLTFYLMLWILNYSCRRAQKV